MKQAVRDLENAKHKLAGGYYEWSCFLGSRPPKKLSKQFSKSLGLRRLATP
jgi:hypothetical protein